MEKLSSVFKLLSSYTLHKSTHLLATGIFHSD